MYWNDDLDAYDYELFISCRHETVDYENFEIEDHQLYRNHDNDEFFYDEFNYEKSPHFNKSKKEQEADIILHYRMQKKYIIKKQQSARDIFIDSFVSQHLEKYIEINGEPTQQLFHKLQSKFYIQANEIARRAFGRLSG